MRIVGIDPGLQRLGYGVIEGRGTALSFVAAGVIRSPDASIAMGERLRAQHEALMQVLELHRPSLAAIEETFVSKGGQSTLKLGQARGAIMLGLAMHGLEILECAPNLIKKTLTGSGHADKQQVAHMVNLLLPNAQVKTGDATDALAVAIACAQMQTLTKRLRPAV